MVKPAIRQISAFSILLWIFLNAAIASSSAQDLLQPSKKYLRLVECIQAAAFEAPLMAFGVFEKDFAPAAHAANLAFFNEDSALLSKIKAALNSEELRWQLENSMRRLMFVPEFRQEYASLYKRYCNEVIDFILSRTRLQNPFSALKILDHEHPEIPASDNGIIAFLVHNLAEEYLYSYSFYNPQQKKVLIELKQQVFIGEVGSYSSSITQTPDGTLIFAKNKYTIWQNSSTNPYTALMVPVEETFHIALRDYTQRAIQAALIVDAMQGMVPVQRVVDEWVAVEEAVVGAMVNNLLPEFLNRSVPNFHPGWIEDDLVVKCTMERYKYLQKGIEVVSELGVTNSINLYRENPAAFRKLLIGDGGVDFTL